MILTETLVPSYGLYKCFKLNYYFLCIPWRHRAVSSHWMVAQLACHSGHLWQSAPLFAFCVFHCHSRSIDKRNSDQFYSDTTVEYRTCRWLHSPSPVQSKFCKSLPQVHAHRRFRLNEDTPCISCQQSEDFENGSHNLHYLVCLQLAILRIKPQHSCSMHATAHRGRHWSNCACYNYYDNKF